ncbi:SusC/RagA family TonB-linked outer membrane protein [Pedobacter psychroterrae]|uniref:SusC/RagA family TonB-linked outer membrane protein n=1 Tax=Pedobacter psychroterrae TaxID=2530453 RepID=A0A4R0NRU0_9SPHI|nr:SusC/RagA family TonB-linked outer membrane protein [Pedobacter psychroterrae]TCD03616.1 SusC/RagA family TonB-linked outer membrane protein [Pedobacter psychroterrae]
MKRNFTNHIRFTKLSKYVFFACALTLAQSLQLLQAEPVAVMGDGAFQEKVTIKGTVKDDADNQPLPGVTITDNQRKVLAITNADGNFTVTTEKGTELSFNMLGYTVVKHMAAGNENSLNIRMATSSNELNEVVVTALGIKREEKSLGYSTTTVTSEQLTDAASSNWTDALSGKVAGLNLIRSGSGPTGSNKIILRGENNLTGENEALIVLDGVVMNNGSGRRSANAGESAYGTSSDNMPADYGSSINDINPEDIESVTVLKGPGAAALYGQRGANGAIIITTKSGSAKKKGIGISINSKAEMETINRFPDLQFEYGQGLDGVAYYSYGASLDGASTSGTSSAYGPKFDGQYFFQYNPDLQAVGAVRTPWVGYENKVNKYFETANTITNSVSIDGGSEKNTARFSVTNVKNQWIMPNTGYGRNSVSLSLNSKVSDKLSITSKIQYQNRFSDNLPGAGYGNQSIMYWYIFWQPNADLDWLKNYWVNGAEGKTIKYPFSSFPENPYAIAHEFINTQSRNAVTGNIQASYNITKDLSLLVRTSVDLSYTKTAQERPFDAGTKLPKGSYRAQNVYSQEASGDFLLRYSKKIGKDFNFSVTGGGSVLKNFYNRDEIRADSLNAPGIYTVANAAGPIISSPYKSQYSLNSFYGLFSAAYKEFLYLDLTGRNDWNSVLATPLRTENAGFFYPSASVSFLISETFELPSQISFAKVRFSASEVGSGGTSPYLTSYNYVVAGNGQFGGGLQNPGLLSNPDLRPLKTVTYEIGTDVRFFKSRLGLDVAYYFGKTKDQHLRRIVDRSTGFSQILINAGEVQNKGIEIAVNGSPLKSEHGLNWNLFATFAANSNKVTQLLDSNVVLRTGPVAGGQIVARVGGSMGDMYGRGYVRSPDGQIVYDERTGFAKITDNVVYIGNTIPKFKTSLGTDLRYKGFKLSVLFDAQVGGVAHSLMNYKMVEQGKLKSTLPGRYNGIIGTGVIQNADGSYRPNDVITFDIDNYYRSHMGADNAEGSTFSTDFIKFREARFDYTLPTKITASLGLQKTTLGVYGRNLFIWSPWPMFDPEFGTLSGTDIVQGFETAQFPSTRSYGINLIVGF